MDSLSKIALYLLIGEIVVIGALVIFAVRKLNQQDKALEKERKDSMTPLSDPEVKHSS